jgi:hypothetical protein
MDDDRDLDGFDAERRRDIALRMVALDAQQDRESLVASLSPIELAQHDLAATLEFRKQYEARETAFPVNESNTEALDATIEELRRHLQSLEK